MLVKTAIVYDRVNKWGGAERVLLALHEMFPKAPLYTSVYHPGKAKWAGLFPEVVPSFLNRLRFVRDKHEYLAPLMPLAFESFDFDRFDLVISVTSEAAKGIITKPGTKHICYCLTPTRYLWSGYNEYFKRLLFKVLAFPFIEYLKYWDKISAHRPDRIISISTDVKKRVDKYYGLPSEIVFPPISFEKLRILCSKAQVPIVKNDYYLVVSRLVPYKKVDLAIETFNETGEQLVVVGSGSQEAMLKKLAKTNISFVKNLTDEDLVNYYKHAKALIFPQREDFGIVALEAQACGTPVIAYKAGGSLDTVVDRKTGVFFDTQDEDNLSKAISSLHNLKLARAGIIENAERFSEKKFKSELLKQIKKSLTN